MEIRIRDNNILPDVIVIERNVFPDPRGFNTEIYSEKDYSDKGINIKFVEQTMSCSKKNVLRGVHGDDETWKLISCLYGEVYFVVINYNHKSKYFGRWQSFTLSPHNGLQVLVPPNYGNGHIVLTDQAVFHYNRSAYYKGLGNQFTVKWNDPRFNISWPIKNPILSKRDENVNL